MSDNFYRAFEDRYRGSRSLIKSRLAVYKPFIEPLKLALPIAMAVDLGCGRGEWLELCRDVGLEAVGVDLDSGMLDACQEFGLNTKRIDAIAFLRSLASESIAVVTSFHVVEHIAFSDLQTLIRESLRVLRPGGLLILETPNPENIVVAGSSFYLDPTHVRPIPPQLLSFLPEHYGFERVKILRLQEADDLTENQPLTLLNVLNGVSPDYAIVARKDAHKHVLAATEPAFSLDYGFNLDSLAITYDRQQRARIENLMSGTAEANAVSQQLLVVVQNAHNQLAAAENRATQAERQQVVALSHADQTLVLLQQAQALVSSTTTRCEQAERHAFELSQLLQNEKFALTQSNEHIAHLQNEIASLKHNLSQSEQANHLNWQRSNELRHEIDSIFASRSWRVTGPIRAISTRIQSLAKANLNRRVKLFLHHSALYIGRRPRLKNIVNRTLNYFPNLKSKLFRVAAVGPIVSTQVREQQNHGPELSKHASYILDDLKKAIEFSKKVKN
jgi:SAM-dependent methyltransferase